MYETRQLVEQLDELALAPMDKLICFDIVFLFTRVPIGAMLELLNPLFPAATIKMLEFVLRSTYFSYKQIFFEQVEWVAMVSPFLPVIADLFVQFLVWKALEQAPLKPLM